MAEVLDPETARKAAMELGMSVDLHEPYAGAFGALMVQYRVLWAKMLQQREAITYYKQQVKEIPNG